MPCPARQPVTAGHASSATSVCRRCRTKGRNFSRRSRKSFGGSVSKTRSGSVKITFSHLLLIYFEKADDAGVGVSRFVRLLSGRHLEEALQTIFQIWGPTRARARRRVIAEPLHAVWRELNERGLQFEGKEDWLARFVADGSLQVAAVRPSE